MYKGTYNENGEYTGFYVDGIHENIPQPNIELNDEEWQQALSKDYKVVKRVHTYSPFIQNQEDLLENLKITRNALLIESDWTQLNDSSLTQEKKTEWQNYRQELRDITESSDLNNIVWPVQPV